MKTSKLKNIAWVIFALVLASTTAFAQGNRNGNGFNQNPKSDCLSSISGLTEEQHQQIDKMEAAHHETMEALRTKRRSTNNAVEKSEIRTEMLKTVEAHRKAVQNLLTDKQQEQYSRLHANVGYGRNQNVGRGQGNNSGNGNGHGTLARANHNHTGNCQGHTGRGNKHNHSTDCQHSNTDTINEAEFEVIEEKGFN
ncbi:hypothetical protein [uncultured Draconibacterium sp.]|uniref:Spy/CpxP family protein refolding chaperone n=1 Tax=uncultured Draconibacterium sp. TaxID=1573823 RepID=UPI0025E63DB7|nr:hypothetical protein [uncultured Draconibacterium sp.]